MEIADILVCLHDEVRNSIPAKYIHKLFTVHQSAEPLPKARCPYEPLMYALLVISAKKKILFVLHMQYEI